MYSAIEIELALGGYYASTDCDSGQITVFRLLDFNRDAYQAALFSETFSTTPTLKDVTSLSPFIGHAPLDSRALLRDNRRLQYLGCRPLTREDLEGYACYLEVHQVMPSEIEELFERLLQFSMGPPLGLRLEIIDGTLMISEIA